MSSRGLKITALILVLLAVVLGVVAFNMSRHMTEQNQSQAQAGQSSTTNQVKALVAVKPIPAYKPITADEVAVKSVPVAPKAYFTKPKQVIGRQPVADIEVGVPLNEHYFVNHSALTKAIPKGYQAVSLRVDDVVAVGGFVQPGDRVNVLLFIRPGNNKAADAQARVLLRNALVLTYEDQVLMQPKSNKKSLAQGGSTHRTHVKTAVLAVPDKETTRVLLGATLGQIRLALLGSGHQDQSAKPQSTVKAEGSKAQTSAASEQNDDVITLAQLTAIKRRRESRSGHAAYQPHRHIYIYRGDKEQRITQ